jgi:hypothetical protein
LLLRAERQPTLFYRQISQQINICGEQGYRQTVQAFDFSPCTIYGGCDLSEFNEEDCFGNSFPTFGP